MKTKPLTSRTLGIILSILTIFSLMAVLLPTAPVKAAPLTNVEDTPVPALAGVSSTHTVEFTTVTDFPANGRVAIDFPIGFNVASATLGTVTGPNGTFTLSVSGQTVYVSRNGDGAVFPTGLVSVPLNNIVNISTAGIDYKVTVSTQSGGIAIDGPTDSANFTISPGATFNPTTGPVNTRITVNGTGWSTSELITNVTVDGVPAAHTLTVAASVLSGTITVPAGVSGAANIVITGATSGAQTFTNAFTQTTAMSTYAPTTGAVGTVVTISVGTGWAPSDTITGITVGGTAVITHTLTVSVAGVLSGTITIPSGLTPGVKNIIITGNISGAQTSGTNFTVTAGATFTPTSGPIGTVITATGTGWVASETFTAVTLSGTAATNTLVVSAAGALSGTITVPSGLTPGAKNIVLTGSGSGAQTFTNAFTVTATATFTPSSGPVATVITVGGTGWAASEVISGVTVGGVAVVAPTLSVSAVGVLSGTITVPAGVGGGPQNIVITGATSGAQTFTNAFNVTVVINLAAGWNLISLPLIPDDPSISSFAANVSPRGSVWLVGKYECGSKNWKFFVVNDGGGTLYTFVDGPSYWVYAYNDCTLSVKGRPCPASPGTAAVPTIYGYQLCYLPASNPDPDGWNMVGFKCTKEKTAGEYFAGLLKDSLGMELSSSKYSYLYRYDTATKSWVLVDKDDDMTPGTGYLIKMNTSAMVIPPCE